MVESQEETEYTPQKMPIAPAKVKNQFSARPRKIVRKLVPIPACLTLGRTVLYFSCRSNITT